MVTDIDEIQKKTWLERVREARCSEEEWDAFCFLRDTVNHMIEEHQKSGGVLKDYTEIDIPTEYAQIVENLMSSCGIKATESNLYLDIVTGQFSIVCKKYPISIVQFGNMIF